MAKTKPAQTQPAPAPTAQDPEIGLWLAPMITVADDILKQREEGENLTFNRIIGRRIR